MKFGPRKPSLKKTIKAKTTGKVKRSVKRSVNPMYGKKGMGWGNDPKRAAYNKVYKQTTFDATGRSQSSNLGCLGALIGLFGWGKTKQPTPPPESPARTINTSLIELPAVIYLITDDTGERVPYTTTVSGKTDDERLYANDRFITLWLNHVPQDMLVSINGIGTQTAEKLCAHRPYETLDDILSARNGIGERTLISIMHALDASGEEAYMDAVKSQSNQTS